MASVISSARQSSASVFDMFGSTAAVITDTVITVGKGVNMLSLKADLMHKRVATNCKLQEVTMISEEIINAATTHTDLMEEAHRHNLPNVKFDREVFYLASVDTMTNALAS